MCCRWSAAALYVDPGATASDVCQGDLSGDVVADGNVDTGVVGTYTVTYTVADAAGNAAAAVVRTVNVVNTSMPVITLNGESLVTIDCLGSYEELGATAVDACEGDLTAAIEVGGDAVDANVPGVYVVNFNVTDGAGNWAQTAQRTVVVADNDGPVVTLLGDALVTLEYGALFVDAGVTATDACEGDVTALVEVVGEVDTTVDGVYVLVYIATDSSGNVSEVVRTVTVEEYVAPPIPGVVRGVVVNIFTREPVEGALVQIFGYPGGGDMLASTLTNAEGHFGLEDLPEEGPFALLIANDGYTNIALPNDDEPEPVPTESDLYIELVPNAISTPGRPTAVGSPKSIYVDWAANPEYGVRGYNLYRTEVTGGHTTVGAPVKLNGEPGDVYSDLITDLEFMDSSVTKGVYYIYQVQAISSVYRPSELSLPSDPPVKGQWLTVFFPDVERRGLFLWEREPGAGEGDDLVRIPVASRCVYDVDATSMLIVGELASRLLVNDENFRVELTGITAGMQFSPSLEPGEGNDPHTVRIAAAGVEERSLYGQGELFNIYMTANAAEEGCGLLHLVEDDGSWINGVVLFNDPWYGEPLEVDLEDGYFCKDVDDGCIHGDVNMDGEITIADADYILDFIARKASSNDCYIHAWDINLDRRVTTQDATLILRYVNGLPVNPPQDAKSDVLALESFAMAACAGGCQGRCRVAVHLGGTGIRFPQSDG
jgi:hypothetical protein